MGYRLYESAGYLGQHPAFADSPESSIRYRAMGGHP